MAKKEQGEIRKLESFPEWLAASNKLRDLEGRAQDIDRRLGQVGAIVKDQAQNFNAEVKAFLETGSLPDPNERERTHRTGQSLQSELRIIRAAIEVQKDKLHGLTAKCSHVICGELVPGHRARAAKMAHAIVSLLQLNDEELAFGDELAQFGITRAASVPPLVFTNIPGQLRDPQSGGALWIHELVANGVLDGHDPSVRLLLIAHERQAERHLEHLRKHG